MKSSNIEQGDCLPDASTFNAIEALAVNFGMDSMLIDQPQSWLKASLGQGALQPTFVADRNVPIPVSQGWRKQSFNLVNEISKLTFVVAGQFLPTVQLLCRVRNCRTGAQKRLCESIESHRAPLQLDIHQDNANVKNKAAFVINLSHQLFRITGKFGHK